MLRNRLRTQSTAARQRALRTGDGARHRQQHSRCRARGLQHGGRRPGHDREDRRDQPVESGQHRARHIDRRALLAQGENVFSYYSPQIHSLAGSSSNTTLVVADGLRIPGGGTQFNQSDPNIIPISAIQRVEVLADGASSVYGSDAVAGVVNFITRRTFDGFESNVAYGFADGYDTLDLNMIWGHTWETGGVYFASQYSNSSELTARDRPFTSRGDYRPIGSNNNSFQCSPSTMTVTGVSSGAAPSGVFLSPDARASVSNTPSNAPCNNSVYATLVPRAVPLERPGEDRERVQRSPDAWSAW